MATITFNRTVDTDPNNTDTFVYVYTPNESGLTTKTFTIERDVYYDVGARETIFVGEWLAELGYDASKYYVNTSGVVTEKNDIEPSVLIPDMGNANYTEPEEL
jgi:hypothetical protein|tara:strand:- start:978 stop:1286 length:309 start_codon:yes stop_codon:yes gene_type:complete